MDNFQKNKVEKKKSINSRRMSVKPKLESNKIEQDNLRCKLNIIEHSESQENSALDERFQKKYRKLFLSKNLYYSLDDEEVVEEGKIYNCYLSPNSFLLYL